MGEAAPTQATPSGFAPMLGVGMGGSITPIATSRGSAVPQLHSAIVERLRARIELCRRHHSICENRYQRGQAENSDREHESTLQLLNIVQQGPGNRKIKGRSGSQQPSDFSRVNGEHKAHSVSEAESKISSQIAQGLRRKIEAQSPAYNAKNGLSCGASGSDFKRPRMEPNSFRPGSCAMASVQTQSLVRDSAQGNMLGRKDTFMMPHGIGSDLFNITLRDIKKEPTEVQTCGQSSTDPSTLTFDFKDEGGQLDPELQDLFDELTKTVPSLNDLELEKMLKQDDDFGLDLGRPSSAGPVPPCIHLDKPIKTEYSPDFNQAAGGSPQLRPASAGPSFSMANTTLSTPSITSSQMNHGQTSRGLPVWPEMSHAEQLKQMAANQQQPNSMLHNHQQAQAGGVRNWSSALGVHQTPTSFNQETIPSAASLSQRRMNAQSAGKAKGVPSCFLKPNGYNTSHNLDTKVLSNKTLAHFSPKVPPSTTAQQMPLMNVPPNKPVMQQPQPSTGQGMSFQNCQLPMQSSNCLQTKPHSQRPPLNQHGAGIGFKMTQQRQGISLGPRLPASGRPVDITAQTPQQRVSVLSSHQKNPSQDQNIQRQLSQQHSIADTEKLSTQDQFSRHLTRPPPDYKQPCNGVVTQQPGFYSGNGSDQNNIQPLSCHLPSGGQATNMVPSSGDRRFPIGQESNSGSTIAQVCASQLRQQPNGLIRMGLQQNKSQFHGTNNQSASFQSSTQHVRTSVSQDAILGQRLGDMTSNTSRMETALSWAANAKQGGPLPGLPQSDTRIPTRPIGPPNQVAPHSNLLPINPAVRVPAPRSSQPRIPPLPGVTCLSQSTPEQHGCPPAFAGMNQSPGTYQHNRVGRLTFDFLQEDDNTVPGINADSDFIDSLLKSGSGNDDWMKDINLEEILGGHS